MNEYNIQYLKYCPAEAMTFPHTAHLWIPWEKKTAHLLGLGERIKPIFDTFNFIFTVNLLQQSMTSKTVRKCCLSGTYMLTYL